MRMSRFSAFLVLAALLGLYQAPNLALLAYKLGMPMVDGKRLNIQIDVRNAWYPIASNDSAIGKLMLPSQPSMIAFHRPSIVWPWRADVFAVMAYRRPVDESEVEARIESTWGHALLIKEASQSSSSRRLYAVPEIGVALLLNDSTVVGDIATLRRSEGSE